MLLLTNVIIIMAHIKLFADLTTQGDTTEFNRWPASHRIY